MNKYYTFIKYQRFTSYHAAENNTKHNWKEYTNIELFEYHSSCKPGSYEYKSAKPKLLAARVTDIIKTESTVHDAT